jgi:hypothetical protein
MTAVNCERARRQLWPVARLSFPMLRVQYVQRDSCCRLEVSSIARRGSLRQKPPYRPGFRLSEMTGLKVLTR